MFTHRKEHEWLRRKVLTLEQNFDVLLERVKKLELEKENTSMAIVNLSSPWVKLYREIQCMFSEDETIKVVLDENDYIISVYVPDTKKSIAIQTLLKPFYEFGNVKVKVNVPAPNGYSYIPKETTADLFSMAFDGNKALSYIWNGDVPMMNNITYVVFRNKVIQYFNDDLSDANGFCSTLYQNIAKDIFQVPDDHKVFFCTDVPGDIGHPIKL